MSIIAAVRSYLAQYSGLKQGAPVWVNRLGSQPVGYSLQPLAGQKVLEEYIDGGSLREFPFAFQSMESTADQLERLETIGFFEALADWCEAQTQAGVLPNLDSGRTAIRLAADSWAYLYEQGGSDTGIYQINCRLTYEQSA